MLFFHSEIKSDLGLERFPSCHFGSNSLILHLSLLAYNILRIIGQISLEEQDEDNLPINRKKKVARRRLRTVMQDLIYMAGRVIHSGRQWFISFGEINPFAKLAGDFSRIISAEASLIISLADSPIRSMRSRNVDWEGHLLILSDWVKNNGSCLKYSIAL